METPPHWIERNPRRYAHLFPLSARATGAHLAVECHIRPDGEVLLFPAGEATLSYRAADVDGAVAALRALLDRAADEIRDRQLGG